MLNAAIVAVQVVVGLAAGSLALLADAGHNFSDLAAIGLAWLAIRMTRRPATETKTFGYRRGPVLVALANSAILLVACVVVVVEAWQRLGAPPHVAGGPVALAAAFGLAANTAGALLLRPHTADLSVRSAFLHLVADAATSVGVLVVGLLVLADQGLAVLDPAVSLAVSALIAFQAVKLAREALHILLEGTPAGLDSSTLRAALAADPDVLDAHDLHVWTLGSNDVVLSAHVTCAGTPTLTEANEISARLKETLRNDWHVGHATLEMETSGGDPCNPCDPPPG